MSTQKAVGTFLAAAVAAFTLPMAPASAEPLSAEAPVSAEALAAPEASAFQDEAAASVEPLLAAPAASGSISAEPLDAGLVAPASPSVIAAPAASASAKPLAGPAFSLPSVKLPFALSLSLRPETGNLGGTGFAPGALDAPAQFNFPAQQTQAFVGTAEAGLGLVSIAGRVSNYGGFSKTLDPALFAASSDHAPSSTQLPYYWPESSWSTYVRAFGLRFGYLSEQFNRGIGEDGAIGSLVGGLDSGFNLLGLIGVDYHALAGWGIHGQRVLGTTTTHVPTEAEASVYVNLGPVNLRAGYVARATFTGDPSTFFAIVTDPMSLASDQEKRQTVNKTRFGTYSGPFFGAGFTF